MILGRAIVVINVPPMPWAHGNTGRVVRTGSKRAITTALRELASPSLRETLSRAARDRVVLGSQLRSTSRHSRLRHELLSHRPAKQTLICDTPNMRPIGFGTKSAVATRRSLNLIPAVRRIVGALGHTITRRRSLRSPLATGSPRLDSQRIRERLDDGFGHVLKDSVRRTPKHPCATNIGWSILPSASSLTPVWALSEDMRGKPP
jgi:hypothetical protein